MNARIISIGNEILIGKTVNTNATFISDLLTRLGIVVDRVITIADIEAEIKDVTVKSLASSDITIVTGGLGPTRDDITKKAIAEVFGRDIVVDKRLLKIVEAKFRRFGYRKMPESNISQAEIPENSMVLSNPRGTAPGIMLEKENKVLFMLPGVPLEMKGIMQEHVIPYIKENLFDGLSVLVRTIRTAGIGESKMADMLEPVLYSDPEVVLAYLPSFGHVDVRLTVTTKDINYGKELVEKYEKVVVETIGDYIFGYDDDTLAGVAGKKLSEKGLKAATAESCTGGLIAKMFTDVSGSSGFFQGGVVAYANEVKMGLLSVSEEDLIKYGAVSAPVAEQMAAGICKAAGCEVGISTTGIAGPTGGTKEKPVGLVFTGYCINGRTFVKQLNMIGDREQIRERTANLVLNQLQLLLDEVKYK